MTDLVIPKRLPDWEMQWEVRGYNGIVRKLRKAKGLSQKQLGEAVGVSNCYIGHIETLRSKPSESVRKSLAEFFGISEQEIWPDWLESREEAIKFEVSHSVNATEFSALENKIASQLKQLSYEPDVEREDLQEFVRQKFAEAGRFLSFREREIVKLRYGLGDGYPFTLEEVGRIFKITRERVRSIEAKAIEKLRKMETFDEGK